MNNFHAYQQVRKLNPDLVHSQVMSANGEDTSVDIIIHGKGGYHTLGLNTNMIKWLDDLVANKLLIPTNSGAKAPGRLELAFRIAV